MRSTGNWICQVEAAGWNRWRTGVPPALLRTTNPSGHGSVCRGTWPRGLAAGGDDRDRLLSRPRGASFRKRIYRLAELGPGDVAQRRDQRGILDPAEQLFCFVRQLHPVMPVADHILHMVE